MRQTRTTLCLWENFLGTEGVQHLIESLLVNRVRSDRSSSDISSSHYSRQTLITLELELNNIRDEGTRSISNALTLGLVGQEFLRFYIKLICSFHTDTDGLESMHKRNQQYRCSMSG